MEKKYVVITGAAAVASHCLPLRPINVSCGLAVFQI